MVSVMQQVEDMLNPKKKEDKLRGESTSIASGPTQTSGTQAPASTDYTKSSFQSPAKIMRANTQSNGVDLTGTYSDQASKIRTSLKSEKDANYTKLKDARVQPLDNSAVSSAVDGDGDSQSRVSSMLAGKFQKPTYESSVSTELNDIDSLQNAGGIASLLRQRGTSGYTSGMANLDARLFQNNPMAGEQINKARQIARDVRGEGQGQKEQFEKDTAAAGGDWTSYIQTLRDDISKRGTDIEGEVGRRREQDAAAGKDWQREDFNRLMTQKQKVLGEFDTQGLDVDLGQRASKELSEVGPAQFMKSGKRTGTTYTETEANRLNNVDKLLNRGGELRSAQLGSEESSSFDDAGYREALKGILSKYQGDQDTRKTARDKAANPPPNADVRTDPDGGQVIEYKPPNQDPINIPDFISGPIKAAVGNGQFKDPALDVPADVSKRLGDLVNSVTGYNDKPQSDLPEGSKGGGFATPNVNTVSNPTAQPTVGAPVVNVPAKKMTNADKGMPGSGFKNDPNVSGVNRPQDTRLVLPPNPNKQVNATDTVASSGDVSYDTLVALVGEPRARELRNLPPLAAQAEAPGAAVVPYEFMTPAQKAVEDTKRQGADAEQAKVSADAEAKRLAETSAWEKILADAKIENDAKEDKKRQEAVNLTNSMNKNQGQPRYKTVLGKKVRI